MVVKIPKKRGNPNLRKGEQPAHLKGQDFAAHPERINKLGGRINTMKELQDKIRDMGAEEFDFILEKGKKGQKDTTIKLTRVERIILDWFTSQAVQKQQALLAYGWGVPKQEIAVSGELKVIKVALKKKQEDNGNTDN